MLDATYDFLAVNSKILNKTKRKNLKYLGWAVLGGVIGGLVASIIAYWTNSDAIVSIGASVGAIALLTMKINEDKGKNAL